MDISLHIINASGTIDSFLEEINKEVPKIVQRVKEIMPLENTDIIVWDYPEWVIEQYGIGGHTMTSHAVVISLDPTNPNSNNSFKEHFSSTLMHELHHAARMQTLGNGLATRLETAIREGLAEHFEIEMTGKKPEAWDTALSQEQLEKFVKIAKEKKDVEYNQYDWLFGNKEEDIPEWTGYSVGFYLVSEYFKNHPQEKASTLYKVKAEEFIV